MGGGVEMGDTIDNLCFVYSTQYMLCIGYMVYRVSLGFTLQGSYKTLVGNILNLEQA